jgi:hypothetical protein
MGVALAVVLAGCGSGASECKFDDATTCSDGLVCEDAGGKPTCVAPIVVRGHVRDPNGTPIANARVAGLDANDAPATGTSITDASGAFELRVSADRVDASGGIVATKLKLRAEAAGHAPFPVGIRLSLPIDLSTAMMIDKNTSSRARRPTSCSSRSRAARARSARSPAPSKAARARAARSSSPKVRSER